MLVTDLVILTSSRSESSKFSLVNLDNVSRVAKWKVYLNVDVGWLSTQYMLDMLFVDKKQQKRIFFHN